MIMILPVVIKSVPFPGARPGRERRRLRAGAGAAAWRGRGRLRRRMASWPGTSPCVCVCVCLCVCVCVCAAAFAGPLSAHCTVGGHTAPPLGEVTAPAADGTPTLSLTPLSLTPLSFASAPLAPPPGVEWTSGGCRPASGGCRPARGRPCWPIQRRPARADRGPSRACRPGLPCTRGKWARPILRLLEFRIFHRFSSSVSFIASPVPYLSSLRELLILHRFSSSVSFITPSLPCTRRPPVPKVPAAPRRP